MVSKTSAVEPERRSVPSLMPWFGMLALVTMVTLGYMLAAYVPPVMDNSRVAVHGNSTRYWLLIGHIFFGAVATVAGLIQIWSWLRKRFGPTHRWTGRIYLHAGVLPSTILAVPVTFASESGISNVSALATTLILWAVTGHYGWRAARARDFTTHGQWMIRNFAVTLSIPASRIWAVAMGAAAEAQLDGPAYEGNRLAMFHDIASSGAWLGLVVNLILAEVLIRRTAPQARKRTRRAVPRGQRPVSPVTAPGPKSFE